MAVLKSQIDYLPHKNSSRYSVELDMCLFLEETQQEIWRQIRAEAAKALANQFLAQHGAAIIAAVKAEDISKLVVEEVVKRLIDTLKEK